MSKLRGFDSYVKGGGEDFNSYVECFDHYWKVMQIEDCNLKKSAFIMALGKRPYKTFKDLLLPATPEDKSFEDMVDVLKEHYAPGSQVIAERLKFNRRHQLEMESVSAKIVLKEEARAVFCKARPVPYALKNVLEQELLVLKERGILQSVMQSDWATPLVVVPKPEHKVRLCGDYKVTLNP